MLIDFNYLFDKYKINCTGLLHVGAHEGQEALAYNQLNIPRVVWIEANPEIFIRLYNHTAAMPNHHCLNYCISDKEEEVEFHVSSNDGQSSSFLELGTHAIAHPDVTYVSSFKTTTKRLDQIPLDWGGLNFLNMDIQGAELKALRGMGDKLKQFDYAYLEVNRDELYKGCGLEEQVTAYLGKFGFRVAERKMFDRWGWGDFLYVKNDIH